MIRDFRDKHDVTVIQGWGMTEPSPLGSVSTLRPEHELLPFEEQAQLRAKAGHGIFGVEMKIVDDEGKELPWDGMSSGELKVRGRGSAAAITDWRTRARTPNRAGLRRATSR